jgi:hypothetical protein
VYTVGEITSLLAAAGFDAKEFHGGFAGEPYALGSRDLVIVARKRS